MNGAIQLEKENGGVVVVLLYYFANATFYSFIRRTFYGRMTRFPQKKIIGAFCGKSYRVGDLRNF